MEVGNQYLASWDQVTQSGALIAIAGPKYLPTQVAAKGSVNLRLDLTTIAVPRNESLKIIILSSAGNFFTTQFSSPVAIPKSSTVTQDYQVTQRDVVTLDGSQSISSTGSVQSYIWRIDVPTCAGPSCFAAGDCSVSEFQTLADLDTFFLSGSSIRYAPESLFGGVPPINVCYSGPIRATLTVTDQNGFTATSQPIILPIDPNIAPTSPQ